MPWYLCGCPAPGLYGILCSFPGLLGEHNIGSVGIGCESGVMSDDEVPGDEFNVREFFWWSSISGRGA